MVHTAGGGYLTPGQAQNIWDRTILPLGRKLGILTGYVKPQEGTSKRTAAGNRQLQLKWYTLVTDVISKVTARAKEVLQSARLVKLMLPALIANLDEECLHAIGKNAKICGAAERKKHDNTNGSSRSVRYSNPCPLFIFKSDILPQGALVHLIDPMGVCLRAGNPLR